MVVYFHSKSIFYRLLYPLYSRVTELYNLLYLFIGIGFVDHQVIMLLVKIRLLIGRRTQGFFPKLMLADQAGIQKNFYGIVDGSLAHMVFLIQHNQIEIIYIEMLIHIVNLFQYGISFGGVSIRLVEQVLLQDIFYHSYIFFFLGSVHSNL